MTSPLEAVAKYSVGQLAALVAKVGDDNVPAILRGELKVEIRASDLLRRFTTVAVSGTKKFVVNDIALKKANVGWTSSDFDRLFKGKVEEDVALATLAIHRLEKDSLDAPILAELGDRAKTLLAYLFKLLEKQNRGEDGALLTNGYANIVYAIGNDGNLWAVYAGWYSDSRDWDLDVGSVEFPYRWDAGCQILSRDS